mgnify:CR=1 FL=1|jgi:hypothetical protein
MNISTLIVAIKLKGEYKIKETVIYTYGGDSIINMHFDGHYDFANMIVKRKQAKYTKLIHAATTYPSVNSDPTAITLCSAMMKLLNG